MDSSEKVAHLEMVQAVVARMAKNSADLKSWTVILLAGLFGASGASDRELLVLIGYFPTGIFWVLDSYYLRQERLFRALFDVVRQKSSADIDFSMNTKPHEATVAPAWKVAFSISILPFYGTTILVILAAFVYSIS